MSTLNSDDENDDYRLPSATRKKSGWAGDEMEMEHLRERQREQQQQASSSSGDHRKDSVAVDLNQFRNTKVGSGYQAKGVIRQSSCLEPKGGMIINMSEPKVKDEDDKVSSKRYEEDKKKRKHKRRKKDQSKMKKKTNTNEAIEKYIACKAIRDFRKEIDKILNEAVD